MEEQSQFNIDRLLGIVREKFSEVLDGREGKVSISLTDALMSGFALFSLKDASLLAFDKRRKEPENLERIYHLETIPSDTQMRTILDEVSPDELRPVYKALWDEVEGSGLLAQYEYLPEGYILSVDGTEYFSSRKVHCANCLQKRLRNDAVVYSHQMLGAVLVSPERKEVLPLCPEAILKQDGAQKNDCERNASKRFFAKLRADHPELPLVVVEDALSSNAPHIKYLKKLKMHFILGAKESNHAHLFAQIETAVSLGEHQTLSSSGLKGLQGHYLWLEQVQLNASNPDVLVNVLQYWETNATGKTTHWTWVTDLSLNCHSVERVMRAARSRWKVENETFNTLKNQGYHMEHNFGHGEQFLSSVFASLMMLAFFVDQLQQLASNLFQDVLQKMGSKTHLWERMRALFFDLPFHSMTQIYQALLYGFRIEKLVIFDDTS